MSSSIQDQVGDYPVFDFSVTAGGDAVSGFQGSVTVEVPYQLANGEDSDAVVIYYINAKGELEMVTDCVYDEDTGMVTFNTDHFFPNMRWVIMK